MAGPEIAFNRIIAGCSEHTKTVWRAADEQHETAYPNEKVDTEITRDGNEWVITTVRRSDSDETVQRIADPE